MTIPRWYAAAGPAYLTALLAVDTQVGFHAQLALGALTWLVLLAALRPLASLARAQALAVVAFATVGEVTGSLIWGVYTYRLHNLPMFIPPAHGLVYLSGLAVAGLVHERVVVAAAATGAVAWGLAGLTVLPRLDVAGAIGVPLLCLFLWRSRFRAASSSSSAPSSCTAPPSAPGGGRPSCRASASATAIHRAASRAATSGST